MKVSPFSPTPPQLRRLDQQPAPGNPAPEGPKDEPPSPQQPKPEVNRGALAAAVLGTAGGAAAGIAAGGALSSLPWVTGTLTSLAFGSVGVIGGAIGGWALLVSSGKGSGGHTSGLFSGMAAAAGGAVVGGALALAGGAALGAAAPAAAFGLIGGGLGFAAASLLYPKK
jgi:hypothetical protein